MAKEKPQDSVSVTNAKKRAYNGVRHGETVNVPSYELVSYIAAWFVVANVRTPETPVGEPEKKGSEKTAKTDPVPEVWKEPETPVGEPEEEIA